MKELLYSVPTVYTPHCGIDASFIGQLLIFLNPAGKLRTGKDPEMPRIVLSEQPHYEYRFTIRVEPQHVDAAGCVGYDSLVAMAGTARSGTLCAMGFSEGNVGDGQTGVIMSDLAVNYRAEAFASDELVFDNHLGEVTRTGFRLFQCVRRETTVIALIESSFATFDYRKRRIAPVPEVFVRAVRAHDNGPTMPEPG
jgi:acyl-CoA thioesterase FadM